MASPARHTFLNGLSAFRETLDEARVIAADDVGAFLRRGLTVASFNLLETFVADRITELAIHINAGVTQFLDLPEKLQRRAITNPVSIARDELKWHSDKLSDLRDYSSSLGKSLGAVNGKLELSPATWKWQGSNMGAEDLRVALRYFHVDAPMVSIGKMADRLGFSIIDFAGDPIDQKSDLDNLAQERHRSAHSALNPVTTLWLRTVPERVLRYGITFDILASYGADLIRRGHQPLLQDEDYVKTDQVTLRFIQERAKDFAEIVEGNDRATRKGPDPALLFADAEKRCTSDQVLVARSLTNAIGSWTFPAVG